jgi:hypothetical protein
MGTFRCSAQRRPPWHGWASTPATAEPTARPIILAQAFPTVRLRLCIGYNGWRADKRPGSR